MTFTEQLKHVFSVSYIFDFNIMVLSMGDRLYMIAGFIAALVAAILEIFSIYSKNPVTKNMWHKLSAPIGTAGILEVIWYSFRYENVRLFGSHFAAWLIGLIILIWLITAIKYVIKDYRREKQNWQKQQIKLKYIK